jgi:hypothetical protein
MEPAPIRPANYRALPLAEWETATWQAFFLSLERHWNRLPAPYLPEPRFCRETCEFLCGPLQLRPYELNLRLEVTRFGFDPERFLQRWSSKLPQELSFQLGPLESGPNGFYFTLLLEDDYLIPDAESRLDRSGLFVALRALMIRLEAAIEVPPAPAAAFALQLPPNPPDLAKLVAWLLGFARPACLRSHPALHQTAITLLEWLYRSPAPVEMLADPLAYSCQCVPSCRADESVSLVLAPIAFLAARSQHSRQPARLYLVQKRSPDGPSCFALRVRDVRSTIDHFQSLGETHLEDAPTLAKSFAPWAQLHDSSVPFTGSTN